jgi:hypothetical protein
MKHRRVLIAGLALVALVMGVFGIRLRAQSATTPTSMNVYSAKFLCGQYNGPQGGGQNQPPPIQVGPVVGTQGGSYATSINVHNPGLNSVTLLKKAVVTFSSNQFPSGTSNETPQPPALPLKTVTVNADWGLEIDCGDITQTLAPQPTPTPGSCPPLCQPPPFLEGYVVIEVPVRTQLDVRGVYTAQAFQFQNFTPCTPPNCPPPPPPTLAGFAMQVEEVTPTQVFASSDN